MPNPRWPVPPSVWSLAVLFVQACNAPDSGGKAVDTADAVVCGDSAFVRVEVGYGALCATHEDGCIECATVRGLNNWGEGGAPDGQKFTTLSLSDGCYEGGEATCDVPLGACGVGTSGDVWCWGEGFDAPDDSQPGAGPTTVAAGRRHACGLDASGGVSCWGACESDSCGAPTGTFAGIASGDDFSCALAADGTVTCWGYSGATFGDKSDQWTSAMDSWSDGPFDGLSAVPAGPCGRTADGVVRCFGFDIGAEYGPFAAPEAESNWTVIAQDLFNWPETVCALTRDGVLTCGAEPSVIPVTRLASYSFVDISGASDRLCGVTEDGIVACAVISEAWAYCPFCTELFPD